MKNFRRGLILVIVLAAVTVTMVSSCTGNRYNMKHQEPPHKQIGSVPSQQPSLELFRRIIIQNIRPHVGSNAPEKSPAIVVGLVTRQGEITVAAGTRNINAYQPPDEKTLFGIGSISKVFTGLMLAQAVYDGKLSLSDKANAWLDTKMQIDDRITMKHLASHYSGLPNFPGNLTGKKMETDDFFDQKLMPAKGYTRELLESCFKNDKCQPEFPPGSRYLYSNLGIGLLSIVLQNRYGYSDFGSLNEAGITSKLSMQKTSVNTQKFLDKNQTNFAQGYQYTGPNQPLKPVPFSKMGVLAGSGELISTAEDMNKLLKVLTGISPGVLEGGVAEFNKELNTTDQPGLTTAYAHKCRRARDGGVIHFKTGLTAGYSAMLLWRSSPEIGLIILVNRGKFRPLKPLSGKLMAAITRQLHNN
jgi:serine-type D-Ala-D-Ala carboxypeptidase/endopeptidase